MKGRGCIFGYVTPLKPELKIKEYDILEVIIAVSVLPWEN